MKLKSLGLAALLVFYTKMVLAVPGIGMALPPMKVTASNNLNELVRGIQENSPAVQAAQAAVDAAKARVDAFGRPIYNPNLELDAERSDITTATLGISQTIDWGNKRQTRGQIAQTELSTAEAALTITRRQVAGEVLNSLALYQIARQQKTLAVRRSKLMQDFAETAKQRQQAGDVNQLDLALARVAYTGARMQQGNADAALINAEAALRGVSGMVRPDWPDLANTHPQLPDEDVEIDVLVDKLPELAVHRYKIENAKARIELSRRERRPDPTIGIRGGREDDETLVGLSLELPLFIRNSFSSEVRAASQQALQAEQMFLENRRRAQARLEGAVAGYRAANSVWQVWVGAGQASLSEQVNLLETLWDAGELSATEYLIQARQNVDTQATAAELAGQVWIAAIEWLAASGQIEQWLNQAK